MAERKQPRVTRGAPLNWPDEVLEKRAEPVLPPDQEEASAAFRRDAKRKKPRLLDAVPDDS
jgi:hypothetical protein